MLATVDILKVIDIHINILLTYMLNIDVGKVGECSPLSKLYVGKVGECSPH